MSGTSLNAALFIISSFFDLYILVLIIRLILVWVGTDYSNPVTQFVVKLTSFLVNPLRKFLPNILGIELATVVLILLVEIVKFFLILILSFGFPNLIGLVILAIADSMKLILEMLFFAVLLQAIFSWIQPGAPINQVLLKLTSPILRPLQRIIPPFKGIDLSPIPALIILQLIILIVLNPLIEKGYWIAIH